MTKSESSNIYISCDNWLFTVKITLRSRSHSARPEAWARTVTALGGLYTLYLLQNIIFKMKSAALHWKKEMHFSDLRMPGVYRL